ncbi:hypothetical protein Ddc_01302 [Ditylenchus destructor]|nr:hypothetical protein Ddc_01302 [Ditylenchus destructor]
MRTKRRPISPSEIQALSFIKRKRSSEETDLNRFQPFKENGNWGLDPTTNIEKLNDDVLIIVFEKLSCLDRMNIELVCRRWRNLAMKKSWSTFREFSFEHMHHVIFGDPSMKNSPLIDRFHRKHSPGGLQYMNLSWFESLFRRCAPYIEEFQLGNFFSLRYESFERLGDLKEAFWTMDFSWSSLTSAETSASNSIAIFNGLTNLFERNQQLEYLKIVECSHLFAKYRFTVLPKSLKCLEVDRTVDAHKEALVSQSLAGSQNLNYLSISLTASKEQHLIACLEYLPKLRGLQLFGYLSKNTSVIKAISEKCEKLEHLTISLPEFTIELNRFVNMQHLTSLSLHLKREDPVANFNELFHEFFTKLALIGRLEKLSFISWKRRYMDYATLFKTLNEIHEGEANPPNSTDPRIVGIKLNKGCIPNAPKHKFIRYFKDVQRSKVCRRVQFGCLESIPNFVDPWRFEK